MVPFAGYLMPLKYTSVTEEHLQVGSKVGVFDVSQMGGFIGKEQQFILKLEKIT